MTTTHGQTLTAVIEDIQRLHKRLEEEIVPALHKDFPEITDSVLDNSTSLIILAHTLVKPQLHYLGGAPQK